MFESYFIFHHYKIMMKNKLSIKFHQKKISTLEILLMQKKAVNHNLEIEVRGNN